MALIIERRQQLFAFTHRITLYEKYEDLDAAA